MATFPLRLLKHSSLHCPTHCDLGNDASSRCNLLGFNSNLFGQLTRWGYDNGSDIIRSRTLVAADALAQLRVLLYYPLYNGN